MASASARARARLEEMAADPAAHKWETVSKEEIGEPGCATWEVAAEVGPGRSADELVASQGLVRMSVTRAA